MEKAQHEGSRKAFMCLEFNRKLTGVCRKLEVNTVSGNRDGCKLSSSCLAWWQQLTVSGERSDGVRHGSAL